MNVAQLAHLRRARDMLDREYARPLNVPAMARSALMSPSLFSRRFREAYGDTPYGYLQTYKARDHSRLASVPPCMTRAWARPGWIAEPCRIGEAFPAECA
jgi:AraC-like DNA-binding protein